MKFKLDENLGNRGAEQLQSAGYNVSTVVLQRLVGAKDEELFQVCAREHRILLTLDFDFSQILRFPPDASAGIVVLSASGRMTSAMIQLLLAQMIQALNTHTPDGQLWIVEPGRIRIHGRSDDRT